MSETNAEQAENRIYELKDDPIKFARVLWPDVTFYREQRQILYSVRDNDETFVRAGNMLGKDFVAGFCVLWFFLTRQPCRIVTTSAKEDHLRVLWGEIGRFIQTCRVPLDYKRGGPLIVRHQDIRRVVKGERCPLSYLIGLVASQDSIAAMQGHHIANTGDGVPRTLFVSDESSSVSDDYYRMATTWANRVLAIGNPWPCENFFKYAVKGRPGTSDRGGDLYSPDGQRCYRKVIRIRAEDSPNVRYALSEIALGKEPSGRLLIPGIKDYAEYRKNRHTWDPIQQCVSLDAEFYEGPGELLFPPEWLSLATQRWELLRGRKRVARAIGIDPAEGGDKTAMAAVDEYGLIELVSKKTPDTSVITGEALAFMHRHGVPPERVCFDRGGGGKEHADRLRAQGYSVTTVAFGETLILEPRRRLTLIEEKIENREERYAYFNRRAQMYGEASMLMDPKGSGIRFALPPPSEGPEYAELLRQLSYIPRRYDSEGRMKMPPKNKRDPNGKEETLTDIMGCSPDEADALVLAIHRMLHRVKRAVASAS